MLDINTLAAWGEFIGGIAVVVSLIYLAGQIRQNSKLLRASTTSTTAEIVYGQNAMIAQDPETARIFFDGCTNRDSLSVAERQRFEIMLGLQVQGMNQSFEFSAEGIGSTASWAYTKRGVGWFARQHGFQEWWGELREGYPQDFRDFVDGLIREGEAAE